jgi:hypothetical protein
MLKEKENINLLMNKMYIFELDYSKTNGTIMFHPNVDAGHPNYFS